MDSSRGRAAAFRRWRRSCAPMGPYLSGMSATEAQLGLASEPEPVFALESELEYGFEVEYGFEFEFELEFEFCLH